MTPLEILEAHRALSIRHLTPMHERCECGRLFDSKAAHRHHVAEVLDQYVREREAIAWSGGFHKGRKTENGSHISTWPKNPYRTETGR